MKREMITFEPMVGIPRMKFENTDLIGQILGVQVISSAWNFTLQPVAIFTMPFVTKLAHAFPLEECPSLLFVFFLISFGEALYH